MKRIIGVLSFVLALTAVTNAQTEKGTLMLGGNVAYSSIEDVSAFNASPNIGYFVANNIAVGALLNLYTSEGYTNWSAGPFVRGYFTKNAKGKPFLGASLNIMGADEVDTEVGFGANAGYALFLNKSIALEFGVNYSRIAKIDMIAVGAGFQIHFKR